MTDQLTRLTAALADRYRIERELGAGGMATVYLAEDLKHHRKVAVKVLRPELAAVLGADRFLQEIKVTANLQHPHILALFDSGQADSFLYYVMPFIEGESLRDKLNRETQLGIEEAVKITTEVADALDYAHRHNVIHRDIKPENILLHDERPMVADFGIALAVSAAAGGRMTETGLSLGTPHYMSPEQATAEKDLTHRSDVYSLGCVLYEMLTGEPPHTGASAQAIIMKIVTDEARPVTELRKSVPPNVAAATAKALEKLPADRFQRTTQFAEALANPAFTLPTTQAVAGVAMPSGPWKRVSVAALGLAAVLATVALWGWLRPAPVTSPGPARFAVIPPAGREFLNPNGVDIALAPDGSRLVYLAQGENGPQLYVRGIDELEARPIPGTEGASQPFFSPDGQWLGFGANGQLRKVASAGGPSLVISEWSGNGASWGPDDVIVFARSAGSRGGLMRVSAAGGIPQAITVPDTAQGETRHRWPEILPGGNAVVFTAWSGSLTDAHLAVVSLTSGRVAHLPEVGTNPHYIDTGHLLYVRSDGSVVAVPFDLSNLAVTGQAIPLLESVSNGAGGPMELALSRNGSLAYMAGGAATGTTLVLVDRHGAEATVEAGRRSFLDPEFSPSGDRLAVGIQGDIWVYDMDQRTLSLRTLEGTGSRMPTWTPDGMRITFSSSRTGALQSLFSLPADGSGPPRLMLQREHDLWQTEWSPDGKWLALREGNVEGRNADILALLLEGERTPRPIAQTAFNERLFAISPDGRWIAYVSDQSGRDEVYVRGFPDPAGQTQVSVEGGTDPAWSLGGRELFYRTAYEMMAAAVETGPSFSVRKREVLFEDDYYKVANRAEVQYDIDPRSGRFLLLKKAATGDRPIVVALNWFEEVRRLTGAQGGER